MSKPTDDMIIAKILELKKDKSVYIIAHYYQRPEIQDIADFVGDSYAMAVAAQNAPMDTILVAGVDFMAESAAILCPDKKVLSPEPAATCPMANSIGIEDVEEYKRTHPDSLIASYVNTPASIKAVTDVCVTSSNAARIIAKLPPDAPIFFIPDENLGKYIMSKLSRPMDLYPSCCPIHSVVTEQDILQKKQEHPEAEVLVHPECVPEVIARADFVGSTAGMVDYAAKSDKRQFIIATECGIMHKINLVSPGKELILAQRELICPNMKSITLNKILHSLETMETVISVPEAIRAPAAVALEKMIALNS